MAWFRRFMIGRYGMDQLSIALFVIWVFLSILSKIVSYNQIINVLYVIVAFLIFYRMLSKNISKRYQENMRFLKYWNPLKNKYKNTIKHVKDARYYRFYKCTNCKQILRVPKGKGKISITCPKCKITMIKKS
jgi:DNA-directed RNA polymerase subunit RPC12/RpoP